MIVFVFLQALIKQIIMYKPMRIGGVSSNAWAKLKASIFKWGNSF